MIIVKQKEINAIEISAKLKQPHYPLRKLGKEDDDDDDFLEEEAGGEDEADAGDGGGDEPPSLGMSEKKLDEERTNMTVAYFFFSMVWSVGATLDASSRLKFDEFFRALCDMDGPKDKYPK